MKTYDLYGPTEHEKEKEVIKRNYLIIKVENRFTELSFYELCANEETKEKRERTLY